MSLHLIGRPFPIIVAESVLIVHQFATPLSGPTHPAASVRHTRVCTVVRPSTVTLALENLTNISTACKSMIR